MRDGTPRAASSGCTPTRKDLEVEAFKSSFNSRWIDVPRVSYHGAPGAFSALAAKALLPDCEPVACDTLELVTASVTQWRSDLAIVPIQNTLEGTLHELQDQLVSCGLHIVGEVNIPVIHCLVALPGVNRGDIKRVLSHPVALAQCSTLLKDLGVVREAVFDTAFSAKRIKDEMLMDCAGIASKEAAEHFGLEVLSEDVHDKERGVNVQRYLLLAREPCEYDSASTYKTSLVFTLGEGSGQLFKALSVFALREMNITKIESRPLRANPLLETGDATQFNYIFYLDFIGHVSETKCKQAMRHLQELTPFFKVLGSYPVASEAFKYWGA
ncbi:arogenate dehydratase/prephenate dehydratase [Chloropicon primus]|uniref:Arogenate dehydratase/prephenate dehydratase n=2 Tax=Chloropicon primus TaxID=1764295 RepID=A0A5B8MNB0_9CHLO|nr:arogenate dehydratase/prephenate dehydratase [Chloropicon primus]UPR00003.1 arogenate dehydratase/prephenate dehydratase [Chloropicon primus]|eukprot:QDZ20790.1 arogenate dehydratase/prephenate dehydratase [Chloropicon primus]